MNQPQLLQVNERTGEISLRPDQFLDRELESELHALAIPVDGSDPISIRIDILDVNDNSPTFPVNKTRVGFSECFTPGCPFTLFSRHLPF